MSVFKRLSATFTARMDELVSRIENHDAVVEVAIEETREATAKAKVRLARVRRDGERLQVRVLEARTQVRIWTDRARASSEDEDTALECVRRRRAYQKQVAELEQALERHRSLEERLTTQIQQAEGQLSEIQQQRNLMRTRQAAAEAQQVIVRMGEEGRVDLDDALERWEVQITEAELATGVGEPIDRLERDFRDAEDVASLRAELAELQEKGGAGHE